MLRGDTTMMTTMERKALTPVVSVMATLPDTCTSMASVSLVKRLSSRPVGWESKKLMGRRTTLDSRRFCRMREAVMEPVMVITARSSWQAMEMRPRVKYSVIQYLVRGSVPAFSAFRVSLDQSDSTKFCPTCSPLSANAMKSTVMGTQKKMELQARR